MSFQELAFVREDPPVAEYSPRYVYSAPTAIYGADTWLGLIWAVITRDALWIGPEASKRGVQ